MTTTHAQPVAPATSDISSNGPGTLNTHEADRLGNIRAALDAAIETARAAETATDYSAAVQRAWGALSRLCDRGDTCRCGGVLDRRTGMCGECAVRREQLDADFRRIDVLLADIDPKCGF